MRANLSKEAEKSSALVCVVGKRLKSCTEALRGPSGDLWGRMVAKHEGAREDRLTDTIPYLDVYGRAFASLGKVCRAEAAVMPSTGMMEDRGMFASKVRR
jgi:hypothetical protein